MNGTSVPGIRVRTRFHRGKGYYLQAKRLSYPSDEKRHPWLAMLLDAYYIVDKGISKTIDEETRKARVLACSKGCFTCCETHKDIPVYPLELVGISWYVTEKLSGAERELLRERLKEYDPAHGCPFLVRKICAVHPVRPVSCRQFNVFGKPCEKGEDPYYSRPDSLLPAVTEYVEQAFFVMFPFYGVQKESERVRLVNEGAMHKMVRELHICNWKSLARKMDEFEKSNQEKSP